jgi:sugar lactone lactonase YvrE
VRRRRIGGDSTRGGAMKFPTRIFSIVGRAIFVSLLGLPAAAHSDPIPTDPVYGVSLFAANVGSPSGMTLSGGGDLFFTDYPGGRVLKISAPFQSGINSFSVHATGIAYPTDLAFARDGRLLVTSSTGPSSAILQVAPDGTTSVFATGFSYPTSLVAAGADLYVTNSGDGTIVRVSANGTVSPFVSGLSAPNGPFGISYDGVSALYFADHGTGRIFRTDLGGHLTLLGVLTPFGASETGVAPDGTVYLNDLIAASFYHVDAQGYISPFASGFAGKTNPPYNGPGPIAFDRVGNVFIGDGTSIWKFTPPPSVAIQNYSRQISVSSLSDVKKMAIAKRLDRMAEILNDSNPDNDTAACGVLKSIVNEINASERSGDMIVSEAEALLQSAAAVGSIVGCP